MTAQKRNCRRTKKGNYILDSRAGLIELEYLNRMTDAVLNYHPKPKTKAAKRRARKKNREATKK